RLRPARHLQGGGEVERRRHAGAEDLRPVLRRLPGRAAPQEPRETLGVPPGRGRDPRGARRLRTRTRPASRGPRPPARPRKSTHRIAPVLVTPAGCVMRFLTSVALVSLLGLAAPCRADDKEARAVVDRAVEALGGRKLLAAEVSLSGKSKGHV